MCLAFPWEEGWWNPLPVFRTIAQLIRALTPIIPNRIPVFLLCVLGVTHEHKQSCWPERAGTPLLCHFPQIPNFCTFNKILWDSITKLHFQWRALNILMFLINRVSILIANVDIICLAEVCPNLAVQYFWRSRELSGCCFLFLDAGVQNSYIDLYGDPTNGFLYSENN